MKSVDLRLDRIFDVAERDEVEESLPVEIDSESENRDSDVDEDYAESRRKYYELLDKGNIAIEGALELAQETDAPRAY